MHIADGVRGHNNPFDIWRYIRIPDGTSLIDLRGIPICLKEGKSRRSPIAFLVRRVGLLYSRRRASPSGAPAGRARDLMECVLISTCRISPAIMRPDYGAVPDPDALRAVIGVADFIKNPAYPPRVVVV